jgi:hypothetical protein
MTVHLASPKPLPAANSGHRAFPLSFLSLACGPALSAPRGARAGRPEQAARVVGLRPRRGRPSSKLGFGFVFLFIFVTDFS